MTNSYSKGRKMKKLNKTMGLLKSIIILILVSTSSDAIIECTGVGYKIASSNPPSTVFTVDPNDPTPQSFITGIDARTTAMGYSLTHGLLYIADQK